MFYRLLFAFIVFPFILSAQDMQRRSFLGIQMEAVTPDIQRVMELPSASGILINSVIAGSSADAAGFRKSDVLLTVDGKEMNETQEMVQYIADKKGDRSFSYELIRKGKKISGKSKLKSYPPEQYKGMQVIYTQAKTAAGLIRLIITKPEKEGRFPTVAFIGGYGCYSLESPFDTGRSEVQFLQALTRAGYMTVRIEKPGIGDAQGVSKPCGEIGFHEEADVYTTAIQDLKKRNDVQAENIYIFGHSMGGVMAPLVAAKTPIKGIIAYGTIGSNFMEYLAKTRRTLGQAYNMSPDSLDAFIKMACDCSAFYFADGMTTEEAEAKIPGCGYYVSVFDERARLYNRELYTLNIPRAWRSFAGRALFIWGEADFVASREDHQILADAVNQYHAGKASFTTLPNATHGIQYAESFQQGLNNPGSYNAGLNNLVIDWLKKGS